MKSCLFHKCSELLFHGFLLIWRVCIVTLNNVNIETSNSSFWSHFEFETKTVSARRIFIVHEFGLSIKWEPGPTIDHTSNSSYLVTFWIQDENSFSQFFRKIFIAHEFGLFVKWVPGPTIDHAAYNLITNHLRAYTPFLD